MMMRQKMKNGLRDLHPEFYEAVSEFFGRTFRDRFEVLMTPEQKQAIMNSPAFQMTDTNTMLLRNLLQNYGYDILSAETRARSTKRASEFNSADPRKALNPVKDIHTLIRITFPASKTGSSFAEFRTVSDIRAFLSRVFKPETLTVYNAMGKLPNEMGVDDPKLTEALLQGTNELVQNLEKRKPALEHEFEAAIALRQAAPLANAKRTERKNLQRVYLGKRNP